MVACGHAIDFTHDVTGREVPRSLVENVALAHTWDAVGNLTDQSLTAAGHAVHRRTFIDRADGNLLGIVGAGRIRYAHDAQGRITLRQKARLARKPETWRFLELRRSSHHRHYP
ncbi:hypothetical protein AOB60_16165 [Streptomyces noursei]|uniref:Uncharacterized protein n=1 Tax=Streptomyces noursei TaxID=1971 RepID=A0A2N8PM38_STRNR|nr:hypothetical protein AOB60_16165 [Streptomyces noursei]